jgi:outer membrane protein OmpA-like peptidoglycan-associated protein
MLRKLGTPWGRMATVAVAIGLSACTLPHQRAQGRDDDVPVKTMSAPVRVVQQWVDGRYQFVTCSQDCPEPTHKVLEVAGMEADNTESLAKAKTVPEIPTKPVAVAESPKVVAVANSGLALKVEHELQSLHVVFFRYASAELGQGAQDALLRTVVDARLSKRVTLTGHVDPTGDGQLNSRLVERRMAAIRAFLVGHGVPASLITLRAKDDYLARLGDAKAQGMALPETAHARMRRGEVLLETQ